MKEEPKFVINLFQLNILNKKFFKHYFISLDNVIQPDQKIHDNYQLNQNFVRLVSFTQLFQYLENQVQAVKLDTFSKIKTIKIIIQLQHS